MQTQQIRGALPRTVTPVSLRYPQVLCILTRFRTKLRARRPASAERERGCEGQRCPNAIFIISKPQSRFRAEFESPLSGGAASCPQETGIIMGGLFDNRGGVTMRILRS